MTNLRHYNFLIEALESIEKVKILLELTNFQRFELQFHLLDASCVIPNSCNISKAHGVCLVIEKATKKYN